MQAWLPVPSGSDFSLHNIPFGAGRIKATGHCSLFTRLGDHAIDLAQLQAAGLLAELPQQGACFQEATLNSFMALGRPAWQQARRSLQHDLSEPHSRLATDSGLQRKAVLAVVGPGWVCMYGWCHTLFVAWLTAGCGQADLDMTLPAHIGDYTGMICSPVMASQLAAAAELLACADFYASKEHAMTCSSILRGGSTALNPNW